MCLILFAWRRHPHYPLVLAANRDEFHARPTAPAQFWPHAPGILAGRDLQAGGTWLGITRSGRFAAVTNYREPGRTVTPAVSRGRLVQEFLLGAESPVDYLRAVDARADAYNGFGLLAGDLERLCFYSNRGAGIRDLEPGLYGLSNHLLDTPWPKVERGKARLHSILAGDPIAPDTILELLGDTAVAADKELPDTGAGIERERLLSPLFVRNADYGTRSSTALLIDRDGGVVLVERSYGPLGEVTQTLRHAYAIDATSGR